MVSLEVCANSTESAVAAQEGGAARVELCDNLHEGGTTPSAGQILFSRKLLHIRLYVLIRPRGGDFLYTDLEFEVMQADIR
ncbi:MAG: copper homeostasis protein CutC, partial [Sphingobacteriales bacterium]